MSLDIVLNRIDRVYKPGDRVSGTVELTSKGSMSHSGIKLLVEGTVTLTLSARSIGLFEAFTSSLKPIQLLNLEIEINTGSHKVLDGVTEYPFEFILQPSPGPNSIGELFDTYHGVYVNIHYLITADMKTGIMSKNVKKQREFVVELAPEPKTHLIESTAIPFQFTVSPASLSNVRESSKRKIPEFLFSGNLQHINCCIDSALLGELLIEKCAAEIKSIELQLVRIESCSYLEGEAREATEIQNIQIAEGNIVRGLLIPIYMVFPRLFTCSTTIAKQFKIEFEVNLIIQFADTHMVTENFPIKLYR